MIVDYKILESSNYVSLEKSVLLHIKNGWQPIGGIAVNNSKCYQAIIKEE